MARRTETGAAKQESLLSIIRRAERVAADIKAEMRQQAELKGSGLTLTDVKELESVQEFERLGAEFRRAVERAGRE